MSNRLSPAIPKLPAALSNAKRGVVAVAMWEAKIPRPAFRSYLGGARNHDHAWVIDAAGTRRRLAAMFRYAAFPFSDFVAESVSVRRGTCGVPVSRAQSGYSWTLKYAGQYGSLLRQQLSDAGMSDAEAQQIVDELAGVLEAAAGGRHRAIRSIRGWVGATIDRHRAGLFRPEFGRRVAARRLAFVAVHAEPLKTGDKRVIDAHLEQMRSLIRAARQA